MCTVSGESGQDAESSRTPFQISTYYRRNSVIRLEIITKISLLILLFHSMLVGA